MIAGISASSSRASEAKRATGLGEAVAGLAMKEDTPLCGLERTYPASQQACDDTGQRVSRS